MNLYDVPQNKSFQKAMALAVFKSKIDNHFEMSRQITWPELLIYKKNHDPLIVQHHVKHIFSKSVKDSLPFNFGHVHIRTGRVHFQIPSFKKLIDHCQ